MTISSRNKDDQPSVWDFDPVPDQKIVTTSWDDGVIHDMRIAHLLKERGLLGTFYVPIAGRFSCLAMTPSDLRSLAALGFEVGAHGYSHVDLSACGTAEMSREVTMCRMELEQVLGGEVRMFAYPQGRYSGEALRAVKKAGYVGARTTRMFSFGTNFDPYRMPTTLQVYPHTKVDYLRNLLRGNNFSQTWKFLTKLRNVGKWTDLAKGLFDDVMKHGGIWHLYGHSWEIQQHGLWDDLIEVLDHVSRRESVQYLSNFQLLDAIHTRKIPAISGVAVHNS